MFEERMMKVFVLLLALFGAALCEPIIYFQEEFNDGDVWLNRWVVSKKKGAEQGEFGLSHGKWFGDPAKDMGLQTTTDNRFYTISARFPKFTNEGKNLVIQYTVKFENFIECGGGYIKLFDSNLKQEELDGETPYQIMFGPDICGSDKKVHVIFNYKGKYVPLRKTIRPKDDHLTHLYTLIVRTDHTYEIKIDNVRQDGGKLEDNFEFLPPRMIKDPNAKKPDDWDEREMIDDPTDSKPADWDQPEMILDMEAEKPDDWDPEFDGKWERPMIKNPAFKGEWKAKQIENANYYGKWERPWIKNPVHVPDERLYIINEINGVGLDLWQNQAGTYFDNFLITNDVLFAKQVGEATWGKSMEKEKEMKEKIEEEEKNKKEAEEAAKNAEEEKKKQEGQAGEWKPKQIKNPNYKGKFDPPIIENPDYRGLRDPDLYIINDLSFVGIDVWQVKSGMIWDNFLFTNEETYAKEWGDAVWGEMKDYEKNMKQVYDDAQQHKRDDEFRKQQEEEKEQKRAMDETLRRQEADKKTNYRRYDKERERFAREDAEKEMDDEYEDFEDEEEEEFERRRRRRRRRYDYDGPEDGYDPEEDFDPYDEPYDGEEDYYDEGEWKPTKPKIKNPDYKGKWVTDKMVPNPDYVGDTVMDDRVYIFDDISAVGIDTWQVKAVTIFDHFLITDDANFAKDTGEETWGKTKLGEMLKKEDVDYAARLKKEEEDRAWRRAQNAEYRAEQEKLRQEHEKKREEGVLKIKDEVDKAKKSGWYEDEEEYLDEEEEEEEEEGDWSPRQMENPYFSGMWEPPEIENPEYVGEVDVDTVVIYDDISGIGVDVWQVKAGAIFDHFLITDQPGHAIRVAEDTWGKTKDSEMYNKEQMDNEERRKRIEEKKKQELEEEVKRREERMRQEEERKKKEAEEEEKLEDEYFGDEYLDEGDEEFLHDEL